MRWNHRSTLVRCILGIAAVSFSVRLMADAPAEPHFQGLGTYTRKITTHSPEAQKYFDQGLAFLYGFNHDEAIRSFQAAAANDRGSRDDLLGNRDGQRAAHQQHTRRPVACEGGLESA